MIMSIDKKGRNDDYFNRLVNRCPRLGAVLQ